MNFSLSELVVVLLVALLVIKPEQLPDVAHSIGKFAKSIRRVFASVKGEVNGLLDSIDKPNEQQQNKK